MFSGALLYDLKSPWAKLSELKSTHPLTGKRLKRLSVFAAKPMIDFKRVESIPIDNRRLFSGFLKDVAVLAIPFAVFIVILALVLAGFYPGLSAFSKFPVTVTLNLFAQLAFIFLLGLSLFSLGVGAIVVTVYKYPGGEAEDSTIARLMSDVYTSPVRGRKVRLDGRLVGRGVPGNGRHGQPRARANCPSF